MRSTLLSYSPACRRASMASLGFLATARRTSKGRREAGTSLTPYRRGPKPAVQGQRGGRHDSSNAYLVDGGIPVCSGCQPLGTARGSAPARCVPAPRNRKGSRNGCPSPPKAKRASVRPLRDRCGSGSPHARESLDKDARRTRCCSPSPPCRARRLPRRRRPKPRLLRAANPG